jgi:hypothetical protein
MMWMHTIFLRFGSSIHPTRLRISFRDRFLAIFTRFMAQVRLNRLDSVLNRLAALPHHVVELVWV